MHTLDTLRAGMAPLPHYLGIELIEAAPDRVVAKVTQTQPIL